MQPSLFASVLSAIASPLLRRYKSFTPGDLRSEIQAQHYQHPSYSMAWRALSKCKMDNMLENKRFFMLLDGLFTKFSMHNPESHCILEKNSDDTFARAFLSPRALQLAFRNCRLMVILDACHLRSKYGGVVMSAVAHDGEELSKPGIVVMHDREKGLQNAQKLVLPNSKNKLYNNLSSEIPENIQRRFNENKRKELQRQIHQFAEFGFEVVNQANGHKRIINLTLKTCTCGKFQEYQFPCYHAAVVLVKAGLSPIHFMAASYYTSSLQAIYSNPVTPVVLDDIVSGRNCFASYHHETSRTTKIQANKIKRGNKL
ncbi:hypothetical protein BASA50_010048 [Batrachochytrium salamandrivorans]|uniref:SWIM-type domain-containing protein n=1 Tax=Batrachochytrium salamandrivorans TaxID=1357716 RepID=A0ABQ8F2M5_9FUNG|nr:hypothetical protein BASA50_010048 [Batrachochytrium salamandrivorans]